VSATIHQLNEREASGYKLDNLRMVHRQTQGTVRAKSSALKTAEIVQADLEAAVAALQKVARGLAEIPHSVLGRMRSGGSTNPLTPAQRIGGPALREIMDGMIEGAAIQISAAAKDVERIRGELAQAEAEVSKLEQKIEELAAT
jgi:hypothetical protein